MDNVILSDVFLHPIYGRNNFRVHPVVIQCPGCSVEYCHMAIDRKTYCSDDCKKSVQRARRKQRKDELSTPQERTAKMNAVAWLKGFRNYNDLCQQRYGDHLRVRAAAQASVKGSRSCARVPLSREERARLLAIYAECRKLNREAGSIVYNVDHIVPISQGGKHHPDNLQILSVTDHAAKTLNESNEDAC
jgi:HNH endonuclease